MPDAYLAEIAEQPMILERLAARFALNWGAALADVRKRLEHGHFDRVILTGMGGSLHGAYPAELALSGALSIPVLRWETGELTQQVPNIVTARTLLIAISQSGESGELHRLVAGPRPAVAIAVTNAAGNTLATWADLAITTEAGPERTASTKTYTAGIAALHLLVAHLSADDTAAASGAASIVEIARAMPALLARLPAEAGAAAAHLGATSPLTVVGRGPSYASAAMGALLIEEAAKLPCEPLTGAQFRHGPLELVREGFRAIVFPGDSEARRLTEPLLDRIGSLGGRAVSIGVGPGARTAGVFPIELPALPAALLPIAEILPIQFLAVPLALARGFEPAAFLNAQKITTGE